MERTKLWTCVHELSGMSDTDIQYKPKKYVIRKQDKVS